jgi:hypothetical protein
MLFTQLTAFPDAVAGNIHRSSGRQLRPSRTTSRHFRIGCHSISEDLVSQFTPSVADNRSLPRIQGGSLDFAVALGAIIIFGAAIHTFQYQHAMGESDLYRVLVGILDGAETGKGIGSGLHYDSDFGFGYLAAVYAFTDPQILHDPDRLMALMNDIGFWSILPGLLCFWFAVRLVHGSLVATVALVVFAFSPMMLELATSGHQSMPMFAFLSAAAICMFLPVTGWQANIPALLASVLLLAGLLMRGEIFLAFPWLVLSRIDVRSLRHLILSGMIRSLPPLGALVMFYIIQQNTVHTAMGSTIGQYFFEFYTWSTVIPGFVYMAVGCGLATTAVGAVVALWIGWRALSGAGYHVDASVARLAGPAALVIIPLAFFVPNPMPTRHFMMTLAGTGILIGIAAASLPMVRRGIVYAAIVGLVAANQVLAEVARPVLLRQNEAYSPYIPVAAAYRTPTHANIGWVWQRHAALVERREQSQAFADRLVSGCNTNIILFSDEGELFFSRLYSGGAIVGAKRYSSGRLAGLIGKYNGKSVIVLSKMNAWPEDAVAAVLADPSLDGYKIAADPYSMSIYDKTPIPPSREVRLACAP